RPAQFDSDHRSASNPFSVGPAGCLGKSLAWAEMRLLISRLLWAFDIAEEEGKSLDWDSLKSMMIVQKEPMELRIKAREATFKKNAQD
ncbi:MAG: hypothetical protein M1830_004045, partial [Pleopsidium flavum]